MRPWVVAFVVVTLVVAATVLFVAEAMATVQDGGSGGPLCWYQWYSYIEWRWISSWGPCG